MKKLIVMLSVCFLAFGFTMGCSDDDDDKGESLTKKFCKFADSCLEDYDYDKCVEDNTKAWDNAGSCKSKIESYVKCTLKLSCDEFKNDDGCEEEQEKYAECYNKENSEE